MKQNNQQSAEATKAEVKAAADQGDVNLEEKVKSMLSTAVENANKKVATEHCADGKDLHSHSMQWCVITIELHNYTFED